MQGTSCNNFMLYLSTLKPGQLHPSKIFCRRNGSSVLTILYVNFDIVTCRADEADSKSWEDFLSVVTVLVTEKRY